MSHIRRLIASFTIILTLALPSMAGEMDTTITAPPPNNPQSSSVATQSGEDSITIAIVFAIADVDILGTFLTF